MKPSRLVGSGTSPLEALVSWDRIELLGFTDSICLLGLSPAIPTPKQLSLHPREAGERLQVGADIAWGWGATCAYEKGCSPVNRISGKSV